MHICQLARRQCQRDTSFNISTYLLLETKRPTWICTSCLVGIIWSKGVCWGQAWGIGYQCCCYHWYSSRPNLDTVLASDLCANVQNRGLGFGKAEKTEKKIELYKGGKKTPGLFHFFRCLICMLETWLVSKWHWGIKGRWHLIKRYLHMMSRGFAGAKKLPPRWEICLYFGTAGYWYCYLHVNLRDQRTSSVAWKEKERLFGDLDSK